MANYNGSLEAVDCHIHSVRYDMVRYDMVLESRAGGRLRCLTFLLLLPCPSDLFCSAQLNSTYLSSLSYNSDFHDILGQGRSSCVVLYFSCSDLLTLNP
eukprot:scaffold6607_cov81-Skeletonema_marinoi.AAC.1